MLNTPCRSFSSAPIRFVTERLRCSRRGQEPSAKFDKGSVSLGQGAARSSISSSDVWQVPGQVPKYNYTFPALATVAREEGLGALYKVGCLFSAYPMDVISLKPPPQGFVPKVLRLAPGGGVLLLVVEFTLDIFRKQLGPPYI
jgi:hypothetical protein